MPQGAKPQPSAESAGIEPARGLNVVVTGGATVAAIDEVRYIANASTGRFSAEITEASLRSGANVWHIQAPGALLPFQRLARLDLDAPEAEELDRLQRLRANWQAVRRRLRVIPLRRGTVADYAEALEAVLRTQPIDLVFLAMAVSDYEPVPVPGKIESADEELVLRCRRTPKVIQAVRDWSPEVYLVGFKLLSGAPESELIRAAVEACRTNRADLTVANDLRLLRSGRHTIHLVRPGAPVETFGPADAPIADRLVERAFAWSAERRAGPPTSS
ncbi:phosphopantothenate--cysteine ligase [soil metagenome]